MEQGACKKGGLVEHQQINARYEYECVDVWTCMERKKNIICGHVCIAIPVSQNICCKRPRECMGLVDVWHWSKGISDPLTILGPYELSLQSSMGGTDHCDVGLTMLEGLLGLPGSFARGLHGLRLSICSICGVDHNRMIPTYH